MAPVINERVLFKSIPRGVPQLGETFEYDRSQTIDLDSVPLSGQFILKTLAASVDPFQRGMMYGPDEKSNMPIRFDIGKPIVGFLVGVVVRSSDDSVKVGDHYVGILPFQSYNISGVNQAFGVPVKVTNEHNLPWSTFVGACGMPGQTAYMAWKEYANAKKGETAFVTAGAGPVGSFVIQLAKRDGLKVIASAGSDEKLDLMKDVYGADVVFNYKTTSTSEALEKEGGIDIYWDNVGGSTLDAALAAAHRHARFLECGMISGYTSQGHNAVEFKNLFHVVEKSIKLLGFGVVDFLPKYQDEFYKVVPEWVATGVIKYTEQVYEGFEKMDQAFVDMFLGRNVGKSVIIVDRE